MIHVIPLMSILGGKIVRPFQNDTTKMVVYESDPIDTAMMFEDHGLKRLHFIDMDGVKRRKITNYPLLEAITKYTKLKVDFGGGITTDDDIRTAFEAGASTVFSATVAAQERDKFFSWVITYGWQKIILAADSLEGKVMFKKQDKIIEIPLYEHLAYYHERGLNYVKCTEINRTGTLQGPAFDLYKDIQNRFPEMKIIVSGGVRNIQDIETLNEMGMYAVLFGKSFYEGKLNLKDLEKFILNNQNA
ncbi:MAG: HisA/HisF-related TIM barrel protein [Microscillaceae bacterium]|nr:HisA/HisF-related TIM barrel protein [Microscillaceae bacterium]MDW8461861.1 HisA/HisF-related TIM barrel protein [Cytophagales bacterium]